MLPRDPAVMPMSLNHPGLLHSPFSPASCQRTGIREVVWPVRRHPARPGIHRGRVRFLSRVSTSSTVKPSSVTDWSVVSWTDPTLVVMQGRRHASGEGVGAVVPGEHVAVGVLDVDVVEPGLGLQQAEVEREPGRPVVVGPGAVAVVAVGVGRLERDLRGVVADARRRRRDGGLAALRDADGRPGLADRLAGRPATARVPSRASHMLAYSVRLVKPGRRPPRPRRGRSPAPGTSQSTACVPAGAHGVAAGVAARR